jgi:hypothetical protein
MPAAIAAAIGVYTWLAINPVLKAYAALLTGPPMSKAIIAPSSRPSVTALPVCIERSQFSRPCSALATGVPTT